MLSPVMKTIVNDIDLGRLQDLVAEAEINPGAGFRGHHPLGRPVPQREPRSVRSASAMATRSSATM